MDRKAVSTQDDLIAKFAKGLSNTAEIKCEVSLPKCDSTSKPDAITFKLICTYSIGIWIACHVREYLYIVRIVFIS